MVTYIALLITLCLWLASIALAFFLLYLKQVYCKERLCYIELNVFFGLMPLGGFIYAIEIIPALFDVWFTYKVNQVISSSNNLENL